MSNSIQGYSIFEYGEMVTDPRAEPYVRALKAAVKPDSIVLEIGTGNGFFAVLACQFGAKKVYAIEPDDAIIIARQVAIDNNCADRIEFIQALSTQIDLPERVDVIISDLRGVIPLYQQHIQTIADARTRFLKTDGIQIPQTDRLWATLVSDPEYYQRQYCSPWEDRPYGCILTANRSFVRNTWQRHRLEVDRLCGEPQLWVTLDYRSITEPNVASTLNWTIDRSVTIHGIGLWFDTTLFEDIGFSNSPAEDLTYTYGNAFFPLSHPVDVIGGDRISLKLQAHLVGDDYIWSWQTQVNSGDNLPQVKADFQQSTFFSIPKSPQTLARSSDGYIPTLKESANIDSFLLTHLLAGKSLGEIARNAIDRFPHRFSTEKTALNYVADLAQKYSRRSTPNSQLRPHNH